MKKSLGPRPLLTPTPVLVIGTYNHDGSPNIMTAAWGGLASSEPPVLAVALRQVTRTYNNITRNKAFTVAIATQSTMKAADFAGLVSGREHDKFATLGWTAVRSDVVNAPYADQFPVIFECELEAAIPLGLHVQLLGKIIDIKADTTVLKSFGKFENIDIMKVRPIVFDSAGYNYHAITAPFGKAFSVGKTLVPLKVGAKPLAPIVVKPELQEVQVVERKPKPWYKRLV